jgi:hypothetical protein
MRRFPSFDLLGVLSVLCFIAVVALDSPFLRRSSFEDRGEIEAQDIEDGFRDGVAWYGLTFRESKIGFARVERWRRGDMHHLASRSLLKLSILGTPKELSVELDVTLDRELALSGFELVVDGDLGRFSASGLVQADGIELSFEGGGLSDRRLLELDSPPAFDLSLFPRLMRDPPARGTTVRMDYFDPLSLTTDSIELEYLGVELIDVLDQDLAAHHFRQHASDGAYDVWVNQLGEVMLQNTPLGITITRQSEADATYGFRTATSELDGLGLLDSFTGATSQDQETGP